MNKNSPTIKNKKNQHLNLTPKQWGRQKSKAAGNNVRRVYALISLSGGLHDTEPPPKKSPKLYC